MSDQSPQPFMCKVEASQGRTIVRLAGDLDIVSADTCRERLMAVLREDDEATVVDLRGVTFLDSMGLSALLAAHNAGRDGPREVSFVAGGRSVQRVFQVTKMDERVTWVEPPV